MRGSLLLLFEHTEASTLSLVKVSEVPKEVYYLIEEFARQRNWVIIISIC